MLYNVEKPAVAANAPRSGRGCLITVEGIDGSGKSTQISRLAASVRAGGIQVIELREPGGTAIGEAIRKILLDCRHTGMSEETELLLFAAARAQLVREVIDPALDSGTWVICDRFYDSTLAYQGYGRGMDLDMIAKLNGFAAGRCVPDLTLLLDLPVEAAVRRLSGRQEKADRLDGESLAFMQRTREGYLALAARESGRIVMIDAGQPETVLARHIFSIIKEGFGI